MELSHMKNKHNPIMSHNACYHSLPSHPVVYLTGWNIRSDVGEYYIRLFFDTSTGISFYTLRDCAWPSSLRLYSIGFHSTYAAVHSILDLVEHYTDDDSVINTVISYLRECA